MNTSPFSTLPFISRVFVLSVVVFAAGFQMVAHAYASSDRWMVVGNEIAGARIAGEFSFAFNSVTNEPYLAYVFPDQENDYRDKAMVMRFDGLAWLTVGDLNSRISEYRNHGLMVTAMGNSYRTSDYEDLALAFNPANGEPHIAHAYEGLDSTATMHRFDGSSWVIVDSEGLNNRSQVESLGAPGILAFNPSTNKPYILRSKTNLLGQVDYLTVKMFDGTSWISVGNEIVCNTSSKSIAFSPDTSQPYVLCDGVKTSDRPVTPMKLSGTSWVSVGNSDSLTKLVNIDIFSAKLAFNPLTSQPYLAYRDRDSHQATVVRFDGTTWVEVGAPRFTESTITDIDIAFSPVTHEPYVVYEDTERYSVVVMKFNGSNWVNVGDSLFSNDPIMSGGYSPKIVFNSRTNEPYVAYRNSSGITVKKFSSNTDMLSTNSTTTQSPPSALSEKTSILGSVIDAVTGFVNHTLVQPVKLVWTWIGSFFSASRNVTTQSGDKGDTPKSPAPTSSTEELSPNNKFDALRLEASLKENYPWTKNCSLNDDGQSYYTDQGESSSGLDPYGYGCLQCVSFAAWRANEINPSKKYLKNLGNPTQWYNNAGSNGLHKIGEPVYGAIAVWENHVAVVEDVSGDAITVSQGNYVHGQIKVELKTAIDKRGDAGRFLGYVLQD